MYSTVFEKLIYPITPEVFFRDYWEKKPLFLKKKKRKNYEMLISSEDVDFLITSQAFPNYQMDSYWVRFLRNGEVQNINDYLNPQTKLLSRNKVVTGYQNGNTIELVKLQHRWPPIRKFCQELEKIFGFYSGCHLLLSPPEAKTFRAHYDPANMFLLQMEGEKHWRIYYQGNKYPSIGKNYDPEELEETPTMDFIFQPGDFLYLPRGWIHEAKGLEHTYSLHLIIQIGVYTWLEVIEELIKQVPELRKSLPMNAFKTMDITKIDQSCLDILTKALKDKEKVTTALKKVKATFSCVQKHHVSESFANIAKNSKLSKNTLLKKKENLDCTIITNGDTATIHFEDDALKCPAEIEPLLQHILKQKHFSLETLPKGLSYKEKKLIVNALLNVGIIVIH